VYSSRSEPSASVEPRPSEGQLSGGYGRFDFRQISTLFAARAHARRLQRQAQHNQRFQVVPQHGVSSRTPVRRGRRCASSITLLSHQREAGYHLAIKAAAGFTSEEKDFSSRARPACIRPNGCRALQNCRQASLRSAIFCRQSVMGWGFEPFTKFSDQPVKPARELRMI
jgi:hypothetical protein